jgi:hypothetical protein
VNTASEEETLGLVAQPSKEPLMCNAASFGGRDPAVSMKKSCWCKQKPSVAPGRAGVAIVMLTRRPQNYDEWLRYHLGYMKVDHVFVQVEESPELDDDAPIWKSLPAEYRQRITLWRDAGASQSDKENRPADDYDTLQARQLRAMTHAKEEARSMGIEWLIHIDDDELLYTPTQRPVGEILAALQPAFQQIYIPNDEAVYDSAKVQNCFAETTTINTNRYKFVSYANGKAAVRVGHGGDVYPAGPHQWRLASTGQEPTSLHMEQEPFGTPLMVVHFESCPFIRWEDKYYHLGNTSPQKRDRIPFKFYRESIRRMQECKSAPSNDGMRNSLLRDCSEEAKMALWSSWKTKADKDYKPEDLMPIHIPWDAIRAFK